MAVYSKTIMDEAATQRVNEVKFSIYMNMSQIYLFQAKYDKANNMYILF